MKFSQVNNSIKIIKFWKFQNLTKLSPSTVLHKNTNGGEIFKFVGRLEMFQEDALWELFGAFPSRAGAMNCRVETSCASRDSNNILWT